MKTAFSAFCLWFVAASLSWGQVEFSQLDLEDDNRLVFKARAESPGFGSFDTYFQADVASKTMEALTFYPERMAYLNRTGELQIQNRFGIFRLDREGKGVSSVGPKGFLTQQTALDGKVLPVSASPDGRWFLSLSPISDIRAHLVLLDSSTGLSFQVSADLVLDFESIPASWSPDSRFVVYEKDSQLYYYSLKQREEGRVPVEEMRLLGPGYSSSLDWTAQGELIYVWEDVVYRILPEEFFTRSLYGGVFRLGVVLGKLPRIFDPALDRFWISSDKKEILLSWTGRSLFLYPLDGSDFYQMGSLKTYSYVPIPQNMTITKVIWPRSADVTVLASSLQSGRNVSQLIRINAQDSRILLNSEDLFLDAVLSPDQARLALVSDKGLSIRSYEDMKPLVSASIPTARHVLWKDDKVLIASSKDYIVEYRPDTNTSTRLLLTSAERVGFGSDKVLVAKKGTQFFTHSGKGLWKPVTGNLTLKEPITVNTHFRVFLEGLTASVYKNLIMIRQLTGVGNWELFPKPQKTYAPFPPLEEPLLTAAFSHGSRLRSRQVSLVIRALDTSDGLTSGLRRLADFGWRTTILINGDFLRRNPGASLEIASSGHEVGSLFHLNMDLSDARYTIDAEYLRRGLARMEDDYFSVTQKELALLWQTPGFVYNNEVAKASQLMNYIYVDRDIPISLSPERKVDSLALVEEILSKIRPGSIIPLTLGTKDSKTGHSFFDHLDLLLNALKARGFEVVPVSVLLENSKK